jgi:hypothetical protein
MRAIKIQLIILLVFAFLGMGLSYPCFAQKPMNTLTILYSNNINGEIEPCPT